MRQINVEVTKEVREKWEKKTRDNECKKCKSKCYKASCFLLNCKTAISIKRNQEFLRDYPEGSSYTVYTNEEIVKYDENEIEEEE